MGVGVGQNMVEVKVEGQLSLIVVAIVREVSVTQHNYEIIHTGKKCVHYSKFNHTNISIQICKSMGYTH